MSRPRDNDNNSSKEHRGGTTNDDLKELLISLNKKVSKIDETMTKTQQVCLQNSKDISFVKERNEILSAQIKSLKKEVGFLQTLVKKKNVVLYQIPDTEEVNGDLFNHVTNILKDAYITPDDIEEVKRVGSVKGKRPVVVSFLSLRKRNTVFEHHKTIKERHKVATAYDTTKEQRVRRANLKKVQGEFKRLNIVATIRKNGLYIDEKRHTLSEAIAHLNTLKESPRQPRAQNRTKDPNKELAYDSDASTTSTASVIKRIRAVSDSPPNEPKNRKKHKETMQGTSTPGKAKHRD